MSREGIRVGRLLGIEIRIDWSVLVIFALVSWSLADSAYPDVASGYSTPEYWLAAVATSLLFFASLLAHEMSHSVMAQRLGIGVRDITLWLFGGVSRIEGDAHTPRDELRIALAGPAVSFAIAAGAIAVAIVLAAVDAPALLVAAAAWLGSINALLGVFNLAPAAPLDGGRVLRAWLWHRRGDRMSAAVSAARAGRRFGALLAGLGLLELFVGDSVGGLWFVLLGWFLITAARNEETQAIVIHELGAVRVRDIMTAQPITAPDDASVEDVLHKFMLRHCSAFPLVADDGAVVGLVTLARVRTVASGTRAATSARDIAWRLADVPTASPDDLLLDALRGAGPTGDGRLLVLGTTGELVGIVSPTDISRAIQVAELAGAPRVADHSSPRSPRAGAER
jgi:Zn-dependent protease/CBS domain-containing protein